MAFKISKTLIPEVIIIEPKIIEDDRGFFMETYKHSEFESIGIESTFFQDNHSKSKKGVLRGMHYQKPPKGQAKLVRVLSGEIDQTDGIGLSEEMRNEGYALLCVAKAIGPLEVETQDDDEVYQMQFGNYLSKVNAKSGNPFDI